MKQLKLIHDKKLVWGPQGVLLGGASILTQTFALKGDVMQWALMFTSSSATAYFGKTMKAEISAYLEFRLPQLC